MMYKLDELTDAQALKRLHIYKDRDCERCANYPCGDFLDVIIENPAKCGCRGWEERKPQPKALNNFSEKPKRKTPAKPKRAQAARPVKQGAKRAVAMDAAAMDITADVAEGFGIKANDILGRCRTARIAEARAVVYYLLYRCLQMSICEIGRCFGRVHATVWYGVRKVEGMYQFPKSHTVELQVLDKVERKYKG
jgi:hypothetical protein